MSVPAPRVIFFGMRSNFSHPSLSALLKAGIDVCAVCLPAAGERGTAVPAVRRMEPASRRRTLLPVNQANLHKSVPQLAWDRGIPLWEVARLTEPAVVKLIRDYQPDLLCVACFPHFIPEVIRALPRLGCLNVHPSLLPDNRGPEPLFWTFRLGHTVSGVTVHVMDEGLDAGAIVAQASLNLPEGMTYAELEKQTSELGGRLLVQAVRDLEHGRATLKAQDEQLSHFYPYPSNRDGRTDFVIYPELWEARHVYNFICGVKDWGEPLTLVADAELTLDVEDVLVYSYRPGDLRLQTHERDAWPVRCKRGRVVIKGRPHKVVQA